MLRNPITLEFHLMIKGIEFDTVKIIKIQAILSAQVRPQVH